MSESLHCYSEVSSPNYGIQAYIECYLTFTFNSNGTLYVDDIWVPTGGNSSYYIDKGDVVLQGFLNNSWQNIKTLYHIENTGSTGAHYQYVNAGDSISFPTGASNIQFRLACWVGYHDGDSSSWAYSSSSSQYTIGYTISYNNGGHGTAPESQTKTPNVNLILRPFITGTFTGTESRTGTIIGNANGGTWSGNNGIATWQTSVTYTQSSWKASNGTTYGSSGTYTTDASTTMTAQWNSTPYGTPEGSAYELPSGIPTKANESYSNITITFNANGGSTTVSSRSGTITVSHTFKGWFTAAVGGIQRTSESRVTAAETVYAQYNDLFTSGIRIPNQSECTRSGYILIGWGTSSTATVPLAAPGDYCLVTSNTTLYAIWIPLWPIYCNINGTIKPIQNIYLNSNGTIKQCSVYLNKNNIIKKIKE